MRRHFERKFIFKKGTRIKFRKIFDEKIRTIRNENDHAGNVGLPSLGVTDSNVEVIQQVIQQLPWNSLRRVENHVGLRLLTTHRIMHLNLHMFPYKIKTNELLNIDIINSLCMFQKPMV
ncbi:hypothetical protein NPIL_364281 [Nephila pilipes]|uniref:Uncharacterized protein n=1 Tax=Nephila pilipes TaxID=299642 RepID=A0A8X6U6D9_NEPPI|nr:hypothetical protein NPIL_364281 [Nephila pilipes]